jgi:hypothetical protein
MELSMPVVHPKSPGTVLLRSGFVLDRRTIDRLGELQAEYVWIKYPGMEFVAEQICPEIVKSGQELSAAIGKAFDDVVTEGGADLEYTSYRRAIGELMTRLLETPKAGTLVIDLASSQIPMARSAGQGCFLSLLLGLKLETYLIVSRARLGVVARDVSNLGMGALLRDVGMMRLPLEDRWRWRAACDQTDPTWREHVKIGYEMVRGDVEPSAAATVLHHHQRFDGSGFPSRTNAAGEQEPLVGTDIHIFPRIIAAVDAYEHLRFPSATGPGEPEPPSVPVVRVLKQLLRGNWSAWLDPIVLKALLQVVPPFPVGSIVTLNDHRQAAVVGWDPLDPCRPEVAVLGVDGLNPDRFSEPGEWIDLREAGEVSIIEAEGQDVSADLFFPEVPAEFDVHKAQSALISKPIENLAG